MTTSRRQFVARLLEGSAGIAALPMIRIDSANAALPEARNRLRGASTETPWSDLKREFLFGDRMIPMNAANMAPSPRSVVEALERATRDVDVDISFQNRAKYDTMFETARGRLGRFLGATGDEIAILRNTSEANCVIVAGVPLEAGDEVVVTDQNHPSNGIAWEVRAAREGFVVRKVALPETPTDPGQLLELVRQAVTPKTKVITFSDVSNTSGLRMPTREICRLGVDRGIHVHVDGAQTFGSLSFSLSELGAASFSGSAQKWLMGPREIGVLFVRADRIKALWPSVISSGWGSHVDPAVEGARKYQTLGQRNDAAAAGLLASLDFVERLGLPTIETRVRQLARRLASGLKQIDGLTLRTPESAEMSHGVIVSKLTGVDNQKVYDQLYRAHQVAGAATGGLRLSPHVFLTDADIDHAVEAVALSRKEVL